MFRVAQLQTLASVLSRNCRNPGTLTACVARPSPAAPLPSLRYLFTSTSTSLLPSTSLLTSPALGSSDQHRLMASIPHTGFYNRSTQKQLWDSVTSVSKAGQKGGRARGAKKRIRDLNRGQVVGVGASNMVWPGLNAPLFRNNKPVHREKLPDDVDYHKKLIESRDNQQRRQRAKLNPLERGFSGTKMTGRITGPPDDVDGHSFDGFHSIVLELKRVSTMTGTLGRTRNASVFTAVGNGQGVVGFSLRKSKQPNAAVRTAKNRAAQQLFYVERYNEHTVVHDFVTEFGRTLIHVRKVPEGTGLICHRVLASLCKLIGIKDIWCKLEGAPNVQNMTKAFILGLLRQKSFDEIAREKGLHVVELRKEQHNFPRVMASPPTVRLQSSISTNEEMDFTAHVMGGKVMLSRPDVAERRRFYMRLPGWQVHLAREETRRCWPKIERQLLTEYGFIRSHLFDQYPECHAVHWKDPALRNKDDDE